MTNPRGKNARKTALAELVEVLCVFEFRAGNWHHLRTVTSDGYYTDGVRSQEWPHEVTTEPVPGSAEDRTRKPNLAVTAWSFHGVGLVRFTCDAPWLSPFAWEALREMPSWWRLIQDGYTLVRRTEEEARKVIAEFAT